MMSSIETDVPECLLLEDRGNGLFALVRTEHAGKRLEFNLTRADLVCLSRMIRERIQSWQGPVLV
jgi:hypothetical protein